MVVMPLALRRISVRAPMPGRSRSSRWAMALGKLLREEADEAVGLLHVAGDLGEVAVGGHADGAAEGLADVVLDGLLDVEGDLAGGGGLAARGRGAGRPSRRWRGCGRRGRRVRRLRTILWEYSA